MNSAILWSTNERLNHLQHRWWQISRCFIGCRKWGLVESKSACVTFWHLCTKYRLTYKKYIRRQWIRRKFSYQGLLDNCPGWQAISSNIVNRRWRFRNFRKLAKRSEKVKALRNHSWPNTKPSPNPTTLSF